MGVAKEKNELNEMNIITNKEKKVYFRYSINLDQLADSKEIENFFEEGINVKSACLADVAEELGPLENLKKYRPALLQAYLGGRQYDPINMGVETDLKKIFAEYGNGTAFDITCILELPRECKYADSIKNLEPIFFVKHENDQVVIPSQFVKAVITKQENGYKIWEGPNYDAKFRLNKGIKEERELNRIIHKFNPVKESQVSLDNAMELIKREFIETGDIKAFQKRIENFKKLYEVRNAPKEAVVEKVVAPQIQTLVPYEEKRNIFGIFFQKIKKLFFGNILAGNKDW